MSMGGGGETYHFGLWRKPSITLSSHNGFEEAPIARKDFASTIVVDIGVALGQRPEEHQLGPLLTCPLSLGEDKQMLSYEKRIDATANKTEDLHLTLFPWVSISIHVFKYGIVDNIVAHQMGESGR